MDHPARRSELKDLLGGLSKLNVRSFVLNTYENGGAEEGMNIIPLGDLAQIPSLALFLCNLTGLAYSNRFRAHRLLANRQSQVKLAKGPASSICSEVSESDVDLVQGYDLALPALLRDDVEPLVLPDPSCPR